MAFRLNFILSVLLGVFTVLLSAQNQKVPSTGEIMICAESGGAECKKVLKDAIARSARTSDTQAHFEFLIGIARDLTSASHFELARQAMYAAKTITGENSRQRGQVDILANTIFLYSGILDSALYYGEHALKVAQVLGDTLQMAKVMISIGQAQKELADYPAAMQNYLAAISIFKKKEDRDMLAVTQAEIAVLHSMSGNVDKALRYYKMAARHHEESGVDHTYAYTILNMANDLIYTDRYDTAVVLLNLALPVFEKYQNINLQINAQAQMGRALYKLNRSEEGLAHFEKSNQLGEAYNYMPQLAYNHDYMSVIYLDMGQPSRALPHSIEAYRLNKQLGLHDEYRNALTGLVDTYEALGKPDSALKYLKESITVSDSLFTMAKERQLNELKARYESDLKEEQIKSAQADIALLAQRNSAERNRAIALGLALLLATLAGVWVISRQRTKMWHTRHVAAERQRTLKARLATQAEEQRRLTTELDSRKRELTSQALQMAEKNEMLLSFKEQLQEISEKTEDNTAMNQLVRKIDRAENKTEDWDKFMQIFKEVHPEFLSELSNQFEGLTANDLRLLALMRMNFSNKEIASILHISDEGLKKARYRLRKKLELPSEDNMNAFIMGL